MAVAQNAPPLTRAHNMDPNFKSHTDLPGVFRRGVQITQLDDSRINPVPLIIEDADYFLEQYLSPKKLRLLAGADDLNEVQHLEMKVDTTETSLGNFGSLLPNLVQLKLSDSTINGIRDLGSSLRNLQVLWLCRCGMKELDGLASMTSLMELYLSYNEISDISPITMLDTLEILDLEGNFIDDVAQIQHLVICQKLKSLSLEGNPVCLMPHPESLETGYDYRKLIQKVLPNLQYLDEELLIVSLSSTRKPNVLEDDWSYLEELQKDAMLLGSLVDAVNIGTEQGSRPGTAALRPATAFRPGTAVRRPPTAFHPRSCMTPNVNRPQTAMRPGSSVRPVTTINRPDSADSTDNSVDVNSDLTQGNVICGNPSRALKNRRKFERTKEDQIERGKHRLAEEVATSSGTPPVATASSSLPGGTSVMNPDYISAKTEWLIHHEKRMEHIEHDREAQVLVIDHDALDDVSSCGSLGDDNGEEDDDDDDSDFYSHSLLSSRAESENSTGRNSFEQLKSLKLRMRLDESFDVDNNDEVLASQTTHGVHNPLKMRSHSPVPLTTFGGRQLPMPPCFSHLSGSREIITTATGLPSSPVIKHSSSENIPSPPSSSGSIHLPRKRRQLPQVPGLPSRPPVPKS